MLINFSIAIFIVALKALCAYHYIMIPMFPMFLIFIFDLIRLQCVNDILENTSNNELFHSFH